MTPLEHFEITYLRLPLIIQLLKMKDAYSYAKSVEINKINALSYNTMIHDYMGYF